MGRRLAILAMVAVSAAGAARAPSDPDPAPPASHRAVKVPLRLSQDGLLASAKVNGQDAGFFLLDTGAITNAIDTAVAERLGLPTVSSEASVSGGGGSSKATARAVQTLAVGPIEMGEHAVVAVDLAPVRSAFGLQVSGVLGSPFFSRRPMTLDYAERTLTVHDERSFEPPDGVRATALVMKEKRPYVTVRINGTAEGLVLVDTGTTAGLVLEPSFLERHPEVVPKTMERAKVVGLDGTKRVQIGRLESFEVFGRVHRGIEATFPTASGNPPRDPRDGRIATLGAGVLKQFRLTFDYRSRRLWAEPPGAAPGPPR